MCDKLPGLKLVLHRRGIHWETKTIELFEIIDVTCFETILFGWDKRVYLIGYSVHSVCTGSSCQFCYFKSNTLYMFAFLKR